MKWKIYVLNINKVINSGGTYSKLGLITVILGWKLFARTSSAGSKSGSFFYLI